MIRSLATILFLALASPFHLLAQLNCSEAVTHLIHDIQGGGDATPIPNRNVRVKAIVIGDYQGEESLNGFFIQEEISDWDEDPASSEGIFVYEGFGGLSEVSVGDLVVVEGTVEEFRDLTELVDVQITVCETDQVPDTTLITDWSNQEEKAERFEGMLVRWVDTMFITGFSALSEFGELLLSASDRQMQYTELFPPGQEATAYESSQRDRRLILDDLRNGADHRPIYHLSNNSGLRAGQYVARLSGVLDYAFGAYRLRPVAPVSFSGNQFERNQEIPAGNLRVATFNLENYFNGSGGSFSTSRGARSQNEFIQQTQKLVTAINLLDAHIIGVQEIENDYQLGNQSAIQSLVDALNASNPEGPIYDYVDPGTNVGSDEIAVGFLYQPALVSPQGMAHILDAPTDLFLQDATNRAPLAQAFSVNGETVWVAVNHLKSKAASNYSGRPGADPLDDDQGDGQSYWNRLRTRGARAMVDWVEGLTATEADARIVLLGDFNAYSQEDPIREMIQSGYQTVVPQGYTVSFQSFWGKLDHLLVSPRLQTELLDAQTLPINADELSIKAYDTQETEWLDNSALRSSDHDPIVASFQLGGTTGVKAFLLTGVSASLSPNPAYGETVLSVHLEHPLTLSCELYDAQGRFVQSFHEPKPFAAGDFTERLNLRGLTPGWYALRLSNGKKSMTQRLLVR